MLKNSKKGKISKAYKKKLEIIYTHTHKQIYHISIKKIHIYWLKIRIKQL